MIVWPKNWIYISIIFQSFSGLPSISTPSNNEVIYNGPFIGRARALVDYTPSPYDRDALRFNVSYVLTLVCKVI